MREFKLKRAFLFLIKNAFLVLFVMFSFLVKAQSKKDILKNEISEITINEFDYSSGKEKLSNSEFFRYDEKGNQIEYIEYSDNKKIVKHTESIYDEDNNEISRTYFYSNGKIKKVYKYLYEGKLKISKQIYDEKGELQMRKEYLYLKNHKEKD